MERAYAFAPGPRATSPRSHVPREHRVADYDASQYYDARNDQLTPLFYKADRSMRESGFDPSSRFGPFNAAILDYNPVCLNSLLYLMETQAAEIMEALHRNADHDSWQQRARDRAARVVGSLPAFERPGGLRTSTRRSGDQWDAPFGWAPLPWIAVQGLRRYGYRKEADRVSDEFLSLVAEEFRKHGTMLEKYDSSAGEAT